MGSRVIFNKEYLEEEVNRIKGVYVPLRSSILRCLLVKNAKCTNLHPNPDDEFSMPDIGPNYEIISNYEHEYKQPHVSGRYLDDPVTVERIYPGGYMILNGHHRWAAAMRMGYAKIPIKIVNLPHEADIRKIIGRSKHDLRATLDLDEVVFHEPDDEKCERALPFPLDKVYKERLRHGIPALFRFLEQGGYDIWVYSSKYYSLNHIKWLFKRYHVHVDGIITGINRKSYFKNDAERRIKELFKNKYRHTFHISDDLVVRTDHVGGTYEERNMSGDVMEWSKEAMQALKELTADEEDGR